MHSLSKLQLVWSDHGSTGEWSDRGSTHSNLSEPLHRLIKEQREQSNRGSTHSNLSEPLQISAQTEQAAVDVI